MKPGAHVAGTQAFRKRAPRWRTWLRLRVDAHQASSVTLAGAYPFLTGPPCDVGPYVGTDALTNEPFCFDPWGLYEAGVLTNPNILLAGVIGQGKSALAKSLAVRSLAAGRRVYVPGDPKGEWTAVAEAVGGTVVAIGHGLDTRLNPLDLGAMPADQDHVAWMSQARGRRLRLLAALAETTLNRPLSPGEHGALAAALSANGDPRVPTIHNIIQSLGDPDSAETAADSTTVKERIADGRDVAHGLRRMTRGDLAGIFDGPSTVQLDAGAPMVVLDLSRIGSDDESLALAMTCASSWLESALASGSGGLRWLVYDEAWRLLRSLPLIRRMQAQWKLSRAYGIANLMIVHRLSDLDAVGSAGSEARAVAEGLLADCSTRIVYRQEADQLAGAGIALGLTSIERELLPSLPRGTGLWKFSGRSYVVRHRLHSDELAVFDTDAAMRGPLVGVAGVRP